MIILTSFFIGLGIGGAGGWIAYKMYLRELHKMSVKIRKIQRGG